MSHRRHGKQQNGGSAAPAPSIVQGDEQVRQEIALRAYYRYCERGCTPGGDRDDWLAAEQKVFAQHPAGKAAATIP
ncbi:MAG TPA: DUF2934 domain-containing protein [Vicinamibacterales bacterium]|nr:DUF2934 domain-containing protein [Vicinamibacterales bacterium]